MQMPNTYRKFSEVRNLPRGVYTGTDEPVVVRDPIYPRKSEISCGAVFMFHGHRVDYPTLWRVQSIWTISRSESGHLTESSVHNARLLDDIAVLQCDRPFQEKRITVRTLCVTAAWRLEV